MANNAKFDFKSGIREDSSQNYKKENKETSKIESKELKHANKEKSDK